jgi:hypothetical protein
MSYCNSLSPSRTHSCELKFAHAGQCRQERFEGGYAFWDRDGKKHRPTP